MDECPLCNELGVDTETIAVLLTLDQAIEHPHMQLVALLLEPETQSRGVCCQKCGAAFGCVLLENGEVLLTR